MLSFIQRYGYDCISEYGVVTIGLICGIPFYQIMARYEIK
jgi:hypothetical protein